MCVGWGVWLSAGCRALGTARGGAGTQELARGKAASHAHGHGCHGNKTRAGSPAGAAQTQRRESSSPGLEPCAQGRTPGPQSACQAGWRGCEHRLGAGCAAEPRARISLGPDGKEKPGADTTYCLALTAEPEGAGFPARRAGAGAGVPKAGPQQRKQAALSSGESLVGSRGLIALQTLAEPSLAPPACWSRAARTKHHRLGLTQHALVSRSGAGSPRSRCWKIPALMRAHCLLLRWGGREREHSGLSSSYEGTNPTLGPHLMASWPPKHLPKSPPPNTITLR